MSHPSRPSLIQRLGRRRWFAALGRRFVPLDRYLHRATRFRWSLAKRTGLPPMLLTTTGRRSGLPRANPLLCTPDGDGYVVVASNWGQPHHPAWSANLIAEPRARALIDGREFDVVATLAEGPERERLWALVTQVWPGYDDYARRAGRPIRVFRLAPAPASPSSASPSSDVTG